MRLDDTAHRKREHKVCGRKKRRLPLNSLKVGRRRGSFRAFPRSRRQPAGFQRGHRDKRESQWEVHHVQELPVKFASFPFIVLLSVMYKDKTNPK